MSASKDAIPVQGSLDEGQPASQERPVLVAGKDAAGNVHDVPIGAGGGLLVEGTPTQPPILVTETSPIPVKQVSGTISGAGQSVSLTGVGAYNTLRVRISGQWSGQIGFAGQFDGAPAVSQSQLWLYCNAFGNSFGFSDQIVNGGGNFDVELVGPIGAYETVIFTAGSWTSGTANITLEASVGRFAVEDAMILVEDATNALVLPQVMSSMMVTDGTTGGVDGIGGGTGAQIAPNWNMLRTPSVFRTAQASAGGSTALWTPAAGKRFRLMRYMILLTENAVRAVAGVMTIELLDGANHIGQAHDVFVPAAAVGGVGDGYVSPWIDLGNGILSAAANNVLNINLSAALTAGNVRVIAGGTEE